MIPAYNEAENIAKTIRRCINALNPAYINYEILIIDDASQDGTADLAQQSLGQRGRVIRRSGLARSLSLSVLEAISQSQGNIIAVMDADGSHPAELLPDLIKNLNEGHDLVVASRYVSTGSAGDLPLRRKIVSRAACLLGRLVTPIKDNTSGFFCIRKSALGGVKLTPSGFKIGLEIFVKAKFNNYKEVPYTFADRKKGKSKLGLRPIMQYLRQVFSLLNYQRQKAK